MMKREFLFLSLLLFFVFGLGQTDQNMIPGGKRISIESQSLDEKRDLYIFVPDGNDKCAVLYVLDGEFMPTYREAVAATSYIHYFYRIPPFIVVGISTRKNRDKYFIPKGDLEDSPVGVRKLQKFLVKEVIPFIERKYPTQDTRVLFGASNGGLFALYTMMTRPGIFNGIIASSPTIGHCPDLMMAHALNFSLKKNPQLKGIYMNRGESDTLRATKYTSKFYQFLKGRLPSNLPISYQVIKDQRHVPYGSVFQGLKFIFSRDR